MKKALIFALLSFGMVLGGVSHAKEYKSMTVRIACSTPPGSVQAVPLARLAEIVHKESNGKIKCELYTGGVLGDEQAVVKQLRSNEIQMGVLAAGNLTPFAPKATLVILPYMFPSKQHAFTFFRNEAFMKTFNEAITEQSKTRPLGWLIGGYRVLTNSKRPIKTIDDMAGLKWRVPPVELQLAAFRSWGVEPHPLPWIETFNGLQQGVIDGQENPHLINRDAKFWEVQKYITEPHYKLWTGPVVVNVDWLRSLPADVQQAIIEAGHETTVEMRALLDKQESASREFLKEKGMVFCGVPTDEDEWMKRAVSIWPQFYPQIKNLEIVEAFMKTLGRQLPR